MILMSHPTGNANVREAARALAEAGLLGEFWTCLAPSAQAAWVRVLPDKLRRQLLRRALPEVLAPFTHTRPWHELGRLGSAALGWSRLLTPEQGIFSVEAVYRNLDASAARRLTTHSEKFTGAYTYEDGAHAVFRAAVQSGAARIYDLPIGYWRAARVLLLEEAEREPEWAATLTGNFDSPAKTERKDQEIALAQTIITATTYTRATLAAHPGFTARVEVIPYGAPFTLGPIAAQRPPRASGAPLRVLFVGSLGQRKGTSYVLQAIAQAETSVACTFIGTRPPGRCAPLDVALRRHRWISSCPHEEVLSEMGRHDVLVFPSLFEGFGLVILEAMAQGLPVITTAHTAGPDVITDGVDGYIVPIRDAPAIARRLENLAGNADLLRAMSIAAQVTAARFTWANYRRDLARVVAATVCSAAACERDA
jgi:alpha-maltose-1-phosphate synthase